MATKSESQTKCSYKALRDGGWGVVGPVDQVKAGARVTVHKRDGSTKQETIGRVIWSGDGVAIATIEQSSRGGGPTKTCWECGCRFTYAECRDGDWSDSYCGC